MFNLICLCYRWTFFTLLCRKSIFRLMFGCQFIIDLNCFILKDAASFINYPLNVIPTGNILRYMISECFGTVLNASFGLVWMSFNLFDDKCSAEIVHYCKMCSNVWFCWDPSLSFYCRNSQCGQNWTVENMWVKWMNKLVAYKWGGMEIKECEGLFRS